MEAFPKDAYYCSPVSLNYLRLKVYTLPLVLIMTKYFVKFQLKMD